MKKLRLKEENSKPLVSVQQTIWREIPSQVDCKADNISTNTFSLMILSFLNYTSDIGVKIKQTTTKLKFFPKTIREAIFFHLPERVTF